MAKSVLVVANANADAATFAAMLLLIEGAIILFSFQI